MEIFTLIFSGIMILVSIAGSACAIILPILIIGGIGYYLYKRNQQSMAQRQDSQNWGSTTGTIMMSSVQTSHSSSGGSSVYPVIVYQYEVNGKTYQSQTVRVGDKFLKVNIASQAQKTVDKYPIGAKVTVYYDPNNPAECALER
ncbi:MAG: DUF3592 domain-containing protein [Anaerolineales bacterium]|nr:DUF3592 domain-containing protein [Anaerolineales bacterium]MBX3035365.1 DUF3592 domain-containing protein [Anaerolineales bacterium]